MLLDLSSVHNQYLIASGFSQAQLEQSPTLVKLLNDFTGKMRISDSFIGARASGNNIEIATGYKDLLNIAHELGHANGKYQAINNDTKNLYQYGSANEYAMARARAEGEAIYYEFLVAKELGHTQFNKFMWLDNEAAPKTVDLFSKINDIFDANPAMTQAEAIDVLATLNQAMLPSGQLHEPFYTYDEYNNLVYLNNRFPNSKISNDYQQAMEKQFDWNTYEAKSLANRANYHYGTIKDDVVINTHIGGSVLGQQGQGDLLWGSLGDDILVGNSSNDILLGGQDNDVLVGNMGDDVLAGGEGNDVYYFKIGFGKDVINNNGGGADVVYFADRSLEQLTLITQQTQDLVLNFADSEDELTIKNFFFGGDYAHLGLYFGLGGTLSGRQILSNFKPHQFQQHNDTADAAYEKALADGLALLKQKNLPWQ